MAVQAGIIRLIEKVHGTGQVCRLLAVENTEDQIIEMAEFASLVAFSKYVFEQRFLSVMFQSNAYNCRRLSFLRNGRETYSMRHIAYHEQPMMTVPTWLRKRKGAAKIS